MHTRLEDTQCPWCGSDRVAVHGAVHGDWAAGYDVICDGCGATSPNAPTVDKAVTTFLGGPRRACRIARGNLLAALKLASEILHDLPNDDGDFCLSEACEKAREAIAEAESET